MKIERPRCSPRYLILLFALCACKGSRGPDVPLFPGQLPTILFVTQVPHDGFGTIASTFGNHQASLAAVARGGDLMIRYSDGTLRNLTREAGYGMTGLQGERAIAVREPSVHWDGQRAVFSMAVGAPSRQYQVQEYRWQLYEVSGLGRGETATITKVANQPAEYNNVAPAYAPDDSLVFASDRPPSGEAHLYPQLDEYESAATNSGLWRLDPGTGALSLLSHAPSGVFSPSVDTFGRVLFTKWDHLQRDQQADADRKSPTYGSFTYSDESAGASKITLLDGMEVYPEPRDAADPDASPGVSLHIFNQFVPWQINVDGTAEETLNHIGRHELGGTYSDGSFKDDPNLTYNVPESAHKNRYYIRGDGGLFHLRESAKIAGRYYATYAREFGTASSGQILRFDAPATMNPEDVELVPLTHPNTVNGPDDPSAVPGSTGHYRNPIELSDGTLVASHTAEVRGSRNLGTSEAPRWNYGFRLRVLERKGDYYQAAGALTPGLTATVSWWNPDTLVTWSGELWELDAVEVRARPRPTTSVETLAAPEQSVFDAEQIDVARLRSWLQANGLALVNSRNVTYRDRADVYQPYNLRVPGGVSTVPKAGKIYDVQHLQFFQGDALRGYGGVATPKPGRRLLARPMHEPNTGPTPQEAPPGSVVLGLDGSMAAFVPARRALSWQLLAPDGTPVVRERNWVTFAPGEIRTCPSCHGVNKLNQAGEPEATNPPEALRQLLREWKVQNP
ncbi:MAG TPA: hypothetical protein VH877_06160 [Polyangia bacterium]|nr:hypothetical protein [Polyangia bacterium]